MINHRSGSHGFATCCAALFLALALGPVVPVQADRAGFGEVTVLATVPIPPGSPEGIAIKRDRIYVAGPAKLGTSGNGEPSRVVAFDAVTGQLVDSWPAQGEDLLREHANSCLAFDAAERLYVVSTQLGIYRLDTTTGLQEPYASPLPDLPSCGLLSARPCSPTLVDLPPLPNDLAFDDAGHAYVTDSFQATIWRVPPGGGAPKPWFQDARLASPYIGVNGLRLDPTHTRVYLSVTTDLLGRAFIYTLPLVEQPSATDLAVFHKFGPGDAPDGIAFGDSGNLYVTLALPTTSGVAILRPDGSEEARLVNAPLSPTWPYDSPANIAFDGTGSLLVTNHAFVTNLPSHFTVLDVLVGDFAAPLAEPVLP